jgi:uncharacterized protein YndB with AHSA1/START domain
VSPLYRDVPSALHFSTTLACSIIKARELLITPEGLRRWLAREVGFSPNVGADYRLLLDDGTIIEGSVQGFDPAAGIAYSLVHDGVRRAFGTTMARWAWDSLSADYTLVTLTHTGHAQGEMWQRAYERHLHFWSEGFRNLASVVNQGRDLRREPVR